jgi:hypothetical protein
MPHTVCTGVVVVGACLTANTRMHLLQPAAAWCACCELCWSHSVL